MQSVVVAKSDLGPCAGCGVPVDQGETYISDPAGPLHLGCRGKVRIPAQRSLRLFADEPQETIEQARETIGAAQIEFDGPAYDSRFDKARLAGQIERVFRLMADGCWRSLDEIARETRDPQASISAQLRHLRKPRFGGHQVLKRPRGDRKQGLFEYKLLPRGGTGPQRAA